MASFSVIGAGRSLEETDLDEIREVYETNVFGSISVLKAVIPGGSSMPVLKYDGPYVGSDGEERRALDDEQA